LEAQEVAKLSTNGMGCNFCGQYHETEACLPTNLGLSEEQIKYIGAVDRHQRYPFSNNTTKNV